MVYCKLLSVLAFSIASTVSGNLFALSSVTDENVLISGYNSEIALYSLNNNLLTRRGSWIVDANLTWIQQAGGSFWAIHETSSFMGTPGGAVSRWEIMDNNLVRKEFLSLLSIGPAHLLVDLENNLAFTANYGGGSLTVVSITDGKLDKVTQLLKFGPGCRDQSHPHEVIRRGDLVWVTDLGCDRIYHFKIDGDQLHKLGETVVENGAGPRHMILHETENLAFLVWELKNGIEVYNVNYLTGDLVLNQQLKLSSNDKDAGAEVLLSEDGKTLYVSSRGTGIIAVFKQNGKEYEKVQELKLGGTWPRSVAIKIDTLLMADQVGNNTQVISINEDGMLKAGQILPTPPSPAFVMFLNP